MNSRFASLTAIVLISLAWYLCWPAVAMAQSPITITITTGEAQPGVYFSTPGNSSIAIWDSTGEYQFYRSVPAFNFEPQGNQLTYFNRALTQFEVLDQNYSLIDTWQAVQSKTDPHEFVLLDNGGAIFTTYRDHTYDLSAYGGYATATLISCVIQEFDANHNLVWEWDGLNYNPITGTIADLTRPRVDYDHCNAFDANGTELLISHRGLSQITKVERPTGAVAWKLGGAYNEFTFTNDDGFALQHDIRRIDNKHITLFDNGTPERGYSRGVEYEIDETAKVITRTWEHQGPFSGCCGSMRLQPNENYLINFAQGHPTIREIKRDGLIVFEADLPGGSYRTIKTDWKAYRYFLPQVLRPEEPPELVEAAP